MAYYHGQRGADTSRYHDYGLATAFGALVLGLVAVALGFYWLMQPTVVTNYGVAAYKPPPKAVVNYADSPWVPPPPSQPLTAAAVVEPAPEVAEKPIAAPPKETKKRVVRTAAPRRPVAQRPDPRNSFASSPFGFRPWF